VTRIQRINVEGVARLPVFSHASIVDGQLHLSGMLGAAAGSMTLVPGGVEAETRQALENIGTILATVGCTFDDVVKLNVYLTDLSQFAAMNHAYAEFFGDDPPARITVGASALALGASVEIDGIAAVPDAGSAGAPLIPSTRHTRS